MDFNFQIIRSIAETSAICDGAPVCFSWGDIQSFLEASGVPNPVLETAPFKSPYYIGRMEAEMQCWRAALGKRANFYEIIRYYYNHPWENQNFLWYNPKFQCLFDREQNLYDDDGVGNLIGVYRPGLRFDEQFTISRSEFDIDSAIWWDVEAFITEDGEVELDNEPTGETEVENA